MLDPNNPEDIFSLEKTRNIVKEILDFGINESEKIKIIELLCLELENTDLMKNIINILKNQDVKENSEENKLIL